MTPAQMIADLDRAVASYGQTVTLKKHDSATTVTVKAHVRPVKASELVGPIVQTHTNVILSPTGLSSVLPLRKGDKCTMDAGPKDIQFYKPIKSGDALVRIELTVAG